MGRKQEQGRNGWLLPRGACGAPKERCNLDLLMSAVAVAHQLYKYKLTCIADAPFIELVFRLTLTHGCVIILYNTTRILYYFLAKFSLVNSPSDGLERAISKY